MSTSLATRADAVLDFVGDVRDDLDGAPEIVAAALLLNHRQVDLAGRPVVVARRDLVGEALVVAQVEVGLGAVVGDVDLAVLVRAHRAGVDVDVGVELLQRDLVAVPFEQRADRGGREPLAERGDDAAGDEDVLDGPARWPGCRHVASGRWVISPLFSTVVSWMRFRGRADARDPLRDPPGVSTPMESNARLHGLDADAVLERAQLFERLRLLHRGRRQRGEPQQAFTPIHVQPDVTPRRRGRGRPARERNRRAREIQREPVAIDDHLGDVRVIQLGRRRRCGVAACSSSATGQSANGATASSIIAGSISGSSPCTLTIRVAGQSGGDLRDAVGAALMRRRRHPRLAAEARRPRDGSARRRSRRSRRTTRARRRGAPIDVLDHRPSADVGERLAGEPRRLVSSGDDGDGGDES